MSNATSNTARMPGAMRQALHERTYATNARIQDPGSDPQVPYALGPVENDAIGYVELESDHRFSAFLAALTPSRVLRDRERTFTKAERQRHKFLRQKEHMEALRRQKGSD